VQCLNQLRLRVLEKKRHLFFSSNLFNQLSQLSEVLQYKTNRYGSYCKAMFNSQAACRYRLLTADKNIGTDPSICFAVTSRVLPPTEHEINTGTSNVDK
jgi:hypothetical protein